MIGANENYLLRHQTAWSSYHYYLLSSNACTAISHPQFSRSSFLPSRFYFSTSLISGQFPWNSSSEQEMIAMPVSRLKLDKEDQILISLCFHIIFPAASLSRFLAGFSVPNLGRPGQLQNPIIPSRGALPREMEKERIREEIIASEILQRKRELEEEVRRDLAYEREVALRRQAEQFSLQGGMQPKANGQGLVIAMKPGGSNNKASASSYPPPHKPYKPKKQAKQVSGGGVTANRQQSKPQNIVGKQPILHGEHCQVKCNSVPHLRGGKKQHVPMQEHKAPVNKGNGKGGADVKVRVMVQVQQGKNEVVVSSGTAVRALKPNKPGSNGNNKTKGKPHVGVKK